MWDLPGLGVEPVSPALAGGFLTTEPLGKSLFLFFSGNLFSSLAIHLSLGQYFYLLPTAHLFDPKERSDLIGKLSRSNELA